MNERKRASETDWKRVDAHVIQPHEYDEIPELTKADFARGVVHEDGVPVQRGRPKSASPKQQVTLRLDADVLEGMRATGPGWQTRANDALRRWVQRQRKAS